MASPIGNAIVVMSGTHSKRRHAVLPVATGIKIRRASVMPGVAMPCRHTSIGMKA